MIRMLAVQLMRPELERITNTIKESVRFPLHFYSRIVVVVLVNYDPEKVGVEGVQIRLILETFC